MRPRFVEMLSTSSVTSVHESEPESTHVPELKSILTVTDTPYHVALTHHPHGTSPPARWYALRASTVSCASTIAPPWPGV